MADISQIKLPDNNTYNFKDTVARGVKMYYGICTTAAATAAKVVTVGAEQDFKLTVGALVMVKFTISNSASSVTLNVNSTGAKSIYYNNAVYTGTSTTVCGYANAHFIYMYDGTNWVWVGHGSDSNTTYSAMSVAEGQTATATSARTMRSDYLKQIIQYHAVPSGQGVPAGGTAGQVLAKVDGTDYNTEWIDAPSGGVKYYHITSSNISSWRLPSDDNYDVYIDSIPVASWPTASTSIIKIVPVAVQQTIYVRVRKFGNTYMNEATYYTNTPPNGNITFYSTSLGGTWYVKENHDYIFGRLYVTGTDITFYVNDAGRNVEQLLKPICISGISSGTYKSILNAPFYVQETGNSNKGVEYYRITWEGTSNATRAMVITGCVACNAANAILNFKINYVVNDGTITKTITKVTTS